MAASAWRRAAAASAGVDTSAKAAARSMSPGSTITTWARASAASTAATTAARSARAPNGAAGSRMSRDGPTAPVSTTPCAVMTAAGAGRRTRSLPTCHATSALPTAAVRKPDRRRASPSAPGPLGTCWPWLSRTVAGAPSTTTPPSTRPPVLRCSASPAVPASTWSVAAKLRAARSSALTRAPAPSVVYPSSVVGCGARVRTVAAAMAPWRASRSRLGIAPEPTSPNPSRGTPKITTRSGLADGPTLPGSARLPNTRAPVASTTNAATMTVSRCAVVSRRHTPPTTCSFNGPAG